MGRGMIRRLLRVFKRAVMLELGGYAGRRHRMVANRRFDPRRFGAAANHPKDVRMRHTLCFTRATASRAKERPAHVVGDARRRDIFVQTRFEHGDAGRGMLFTALLVEPDPPPPSLSEVVGDIHLEDGPHPREGVEHEHEEVAPENWTGR